MNIELDHDVLKEQSVHLSKKLYNSLHSDRLEDIADLNKKMVAIHSVHNSFHPLKQRSCVLFKDDFYFDKSKINQIFYNFLSEDSDIPFLERCKAIERSIGFLQQDVRQELIKSQFNRATIWMIKKDNLDASKLLQEMVQNLAQHCIMTSHFHLAFQTTENVIKPK